jgi:hypothetical protein
MEEYIVLTKSNKDAGGHGDRSTGDDNDSHQDYGAGVSDTLLQRFWWFSP